MLGRDVISFIVKQRKGFVGYRVGYNIIILIKKKFYVYMLNRAIILGSRVNYEY